MTETFVAGVDGPVVIVTRSLKSLKLPHSLTPDAKIVALPNVVYGRNPVRHWRDVRKLAQLCSGALSFSVVGADMMDGGYGEVAAIRRAHMLTNVSRSGIDARLLGFSWNGHAPRKVQKALAAAGRAGVKLLVRDPESLGRLEGAAVQGLQESADIVFCADDRDESALEAVRKRLGGERPFVVLNASALVQKRVNQVPDYLQIAKYFEGAGFSIVLVPHVLRASANDLDSCRKVMAAMDEAGVAGHLIEEQLSPSQVRGIAAGASVVVTGRMHLAVMALGQGVPAFVLSTQGKVAGLAKMFEQPDLCVEPNLGFSSAVIDSLVPDPVQEIARRQEAVRRALPRVRELARKNFEGLI
ncbi:polysaccharide pyruvyl transferase family protein [Herbiconiux liukaitaii]|uniref:polysaccharide pyruvyl transferase family protein n=1 Tax=Herbiconiux liukaitaii TaxID=3342799 RepID=UPI0035B9CB86